MNVTELCVNCKQNNSCTMCWKTSNKKCPHFIQKTNADRIRAMTDEELADLLFFGFEEDNISIVGGMRPIGHEEWMRTVDEMLKWIQQPAEGE